MREKLSPPHRHAKPPEIAKSRWVDIDSQLERLDGKPFKVKVALSKRDGALKHTNFWDLDKTLLRAEKIHFNAIDRMYPAFARDDVSRDELHKVYFAGFALGNASREFDRMRRIYEENQTQYTDIAVYEHEFIDDPKMRRLIDEPGHPEKYYERAGAILQKYGEFAYDFMETQYNADPEKFLEDFLKPEIIDLLKKKSRLGQAHVFMTANQAKFASGLVKFSGLAQHGLLVASDERTAGGGKEVAIEWLIEELAKMGLTVNRERACAIGDSIKGDVGSGAKANFASGVLVTDTSAEIETIKARAAQDTPHGRHIKAVLEGTDVEAIPSLEVSKNISDRWRHGKNSSQQPTHGK